MNPSSTGHHFESQHHSAESETTFLDYVEVVWKRKWLIFAICFSLMSVVCTMSLLSPKIYESTASVLPQMESKDNAGGGSLAGMLASGGAAGLASSMGINLPGMGSSATEIWSSILKSRTMLDAVVKEFNLMEVYEAETLQDAREMLEAATKIVLTKDKAIKVTVESKDPKMAAAMANFFVEHLDRITQSFDITDATANRKFVERRLIETRVNLVKAEEDMQRFQTQNKTVAIDIQANAMIQAAATIQAQITAQEVQMQVMETYLAPEHPELMRVRSGMDELRKQLRRLQSGKGGNGVASADQLHPAFAAVPSIALEWSRLVRELKVQDTLYTLLTSQLEQAQLTEARDTPVVHILDRAIPAERKSRPKVLLNTLIAGMVGWVISLIIVFWQEYKERTRSKRQRNAVETATMVQAA